jgi:CTP synthase
MPNKTNKKTSTARKNNIIKHKSVDKHKYIFVIGGVMSGVGKGITTSSIGTILEAKGYKINIMKVDPYLNVDAGTMNPTEHGEVFVMDSGLETDQDMGNYERFLNRSLKREDYMTSGMVYKYVIDKERALGFGGKCIDADNIRDEIVTRYETSGKTNKSDVTVVEIGGTVGDYQNIMFIEAARVMKLRHPRDVVFIMVSYMPIPNKIGEMKSKPTQNAIRQLNSYGVHADFIVARSEMPVDKKRKEKIAFSCNVPVENIISAPDIDSIYDVPLNFEKDQLGEMITRALSLPHRITNMKGWKEFVSKVNKAKEMADIAELAELTESNLKKSGKKYGKAGKSGKDGEKSAKNKSIVKIAVVGKYFDSGDFVFSDAYVSVIEAIKFSAYKLGVKVKLSWLNSKDFEKDPKTIKDLKNYDGIIVPGGFGNSGIEGLIMTIEYARVNKIPYFGLCYGMQLMVIEYARNILNWNDANTAEINPDSKHLIIDIMPEQKIKLSNGHYGASMRLGAYDAIVEKGTTAYKAYGKEEISERHRHRYEVNPEYVDEIQKAGLVFSGKSPNGKLMEIAELPKAVHPFFLGTQFHPEFLARPLDPHPLFTEFIKTILGLF